MKAIRKIVIAFALLVLAGVGGTAQAVEMTFASNVTGPVTFYMTWNGAYPNGTLPQSNVVANVWEVEVTQECVGLNQSGAEQAFTGVTIPGVSYLVLRTPNGKKTYVTTRTTTTFAPLSLPTPMKHQLSVANGSSEKVECTGVPVPTNETKYALQVGTETWYDDTEITPSTIGWTAASVQQYLYQAGFKWAPISWQYETGGAVTGSLYYPQAGVNLKPGLGVVVPDKPYVLTGETRRIDGETVWVQTIQPINPYDTVGIGHDGELSLFKDGMQ